MRKALATTKVVGRDTTWCGPVSKTQAMARAIVTGCGKDDNGARMLFYKLPDGEGVYGAVEEVRAWDLVHMAGLGLLFHKSALFKIPRGSNLNVIH